jgi:putative acetyltransferase
VEPEAARKGVGTALVREIERIAEESGLQRLELLASVNAESFYTFLGYQADGRTELVLRTGVSMAAVKMVKTLR